jgi:hypothetical protein
VELADLAAAVSAPDWAMAHETDEAERVKNARGVSPRPTTNKCLPRSLRGWWGRYVS